MGLPSNPAGASPMFTRMVVTLMDSASQPRPVSSSVTQRVAVRMPVRVKVWLGKLRVPLMPRGLPAV